MAWTDEVQPFGENHVPLLTGLSSANDGTAVPVAVDPATGEILVSSSGGGGGGGTSSTFDAPFPIVGTAVGATDGINMKPLTVNGTGELLIGTLDALDVTQSGTWVIDSITNPVGVTQSDAWTVGTTSAVVNVGQQTVNTSAVQISTSSVIPTNGILIRALSTNSASIFVGDSGVTTSTGFELVAGETTSFTCDLSTLYIISVASTTDKICWNVE